MTPTPVEDRIARGEEARSILESPIFIEAFESAEKDIVSQWMGSPARDSEGREKLWVYLAMLRKVRAHMERAIETGDMARIEIERKASLAERVTSLFA